MSVFHTETCAQLLARITSQSRPSLKDLCPEIILNHGPSQKEIIEITGDINVGKTILLLEFIAQAILPIDCGGKNAMAIVVDTNSNFKVHRLAPIMEKHILHSRMVSSKSNDTEDLRAETTNVKDIVLESLKSVLIFRCYSDTDLDMALFKVQDLLTNNAKISVLAVESISNFYWSNKLIDKPLTMDAYLKDKLKDLRKIINEYGVVLIYTRPSYFGSTVRENLREIDYHIELVSKNTNGNRKIFDANVTFSEQSHFKRSFSINDFGIEWFSSREQI